MMYAHLARHRVTKRTAHFLHIGELLATMELNWNPDYERVALPRVVSSLKYKLDKLVKDGVLRKELGGDEVWPDWAMAWALPGWDGDTDPPRGGAGHGHQEQAGVGGGDPMGWQSSSYDVTTVDTNARPPTPPPTPVPQDQNQRRDGDRRQTGPSGGPPLGNDSTDYSNLITMFPMLTPQPPHDSFLAKLAAWYAQIRLGDGAGLFDPQRTMFRNNGIRLDMDGDVVMEDAVAMVGHEPVPVNTSEAEKKKTQDVRGEGSREDGKARAKGSSISRFSRQKGRGRKSHDGSMLGRLLRGRRPADSGRPVDEQVQQQPPLIVGTAQVDVSADETTLVGDEEGQEVEQEGGGGAQSAAQRNHGNTGLIRLVDDLGTTVITETGTVISFEAHHVHSPVLVPQPERSWTDERDTGLDPELDFVDADVPESPCEGEGEAEEEEDHRDPGLSELTVPQQQREDSSSWIASLEHVPTISSSKESIWDGHEDENDYEPESECFYPPLPIPAPARFSTSPSPLLYPRLRPPPRPSQSDISFPDGRHEVSLLHKTEQDAVEVTRLLQSHLEQALELAYLQIDARAKGASPGDVGNTRNTRGLSETAFRLDLEERAVRLAQEGSRLEAELQGLLEQVGSLRRICDSRRRSVGYGGHSHPREVNDTDKEEEDGFKIELVDVGHDDVRALLFGFPLHDYVN